MQLQHELIWKHFWEHSGSQIAASFKFIPKDIGSEGKEISDGPYNQFFFFLSPLYFVKKCKVKNKIILMVLK